MKVCDNALERFQSNRVPGHSCVHRLRRVIVDDTEVGAKEIEGVCKREVYNYLPLVFT